MNNIRYEAKHKCGSVAAGAAMLAIMLAVPDLGRATKPSVAEKDISLECQVEPTPVLGELFTITMRFTINEPTHYLNEPWAGATAMLGMRPRQEFVSGDTILVEKFAPGQVYEMSAGYRTVKPGSFSAGIQVRTYGEADASGNPKTNGTGSTVTLLTGCQVRIADPNDRSGQLIVDPKSGVSYRQVMTGDSVFDHISPGTLKVEPADRAGQAAPPSTSGDATSADTHMSVATVWLKLESDGRYVQVDSTVLGRDKPSRLIFRDVDTRRTLYPTVLSDETEAGKIEALDDSTFLYEPNGESGGFELEIELEGQDLKVRLNLASVWTLEGHFKFADQFGGTDNRAEYVEYLV